MIASVFEITAGPSKQDIEQAMLRHQPVTMETIDLDSNTGRREIQVFVDHFQHSVNTVIISGWVPNYPQQGRHLRFTNMSYHSHGGGSTFDPDRGYQPTAKEIRWLRQATAQPQST